MSDKIDYKKAEKQFYMPGKTPSLVTVPAMNFFMVDGAGAPEEDEYQKAVSLLYAASFTIKMSKMKGQQPPGYFEYVVPPLEGLWELGPDGLLSNRSSWRWTSMIRQPEFVDHATVRHMLNSIRRNKPEIDPSPLRFATYEEGLCIQVMHIGPYADEQRNIDLLNAFAEENQLLPDFSNERRHHEIYLSDPRRTVPEKLKTVLRLPVRRK